MPTTKKPPRSSKPAKPKKASKKGVNPFSPDPSPGKKPTPPNRK
jgi:hypothetical protein